MVPFDYDPTHKAAGAVAGKVGAVASWSTDAPLSTFHKNRLSAELAESVSSARVTEDDVTEVSRVFQ
jgi:hypothetical protein